MPLLFFALIGCGGGASTGNNQPAPASTILSVAPACTPSSIAVSATSQCTAIVKGSGTYSSAVTWSASNGTVNTSGVFTAPASAGNVTVTATSTQDATKSGTATITVQAPSSTITSVQAVCNPSTVNPGATSQCTATVQGTGTFSSAVTWSASAGTINPSGLLTAPAAAASVTITATSVQDTTQVSHGDRHGTTAGGAEPAHRHGHGRKHELRRRCSQ